MQKIQVSFLGLNSLFGRVTTNLLKQSPCIHKLSLYDDEDTPLLGDGANVYIGKDQLSDAVKDVNIVVIGDEQCDSQGEERLKIIGPKIIRYTEAILKSSPNAIIVVAASPLNVLVPLVGHFLGPDWKCRLLGITSVDTLRASRILNSLLYDPSGQTHVLPVVGGSSATSRVPLFSHLHPKTVIGKDIREKLLEKMKLFDTVKYRETDSVERAYSTVRFIHSVLSGMLKDSPVPEIAMTKTAEVPNADFFSLPMLIGKNGIENAMPLPKFDPDEEQQILEATEKLAEDSRKARDFINSLAQDSVRNSNTSSNVSVARSLEWKEKSHFSADPHTLKTERGVQETRRKPQKLNKVMNCVGKVRRFNDEGNNFDKDNSSQAINDSSTRDSSTLTYSLLAKPCGSDDGFQEKQTFSRKSIPLCPSYQLIPESRGNDRDSVKVVGNDKVDVNKNNKNVKLAESTQSLTSVEDMSSRGGAVLQSPTRKALETSNRTDSFKEHNPPQPSTVHLVAEAVQLEAASQSDFYPQKENEVLLPSLIDSDLLANDGRDSDCPGTLLEEVNDHLGALGTYTGTLARDPKHEIILGESKHSEEEERLPFPENCETKAKQDTSNEPTEQVGSSSNSGITSDNSNHNHSKPESRVVSTPKSKLQRNVTSSDSRKVIRNECVPNYKRAPEYDARENVATDCEVVNEIKENSRSTNLFTDDKNTNERGRKRYVFPSNYSVTNDFEASNFHSSLHKKCKMEEDSPNPNQNFGETVQKRWKKELSDENKLASNKDVFDCNNRPKNISNEIGGTSAERKMNSLSKQAIKNEERASAKNCYHIGLPSKVSKRSIAAKKVASEGRILCLSSGRIEESSIKMSSSDTRKDSGQKEQGNEEWSKPESPALKSKNPENDINRTEMRMRSNRQYVMSNSNSGMLNTSMAYPPQPSLNSKNVKDRRSTSGDDVVSSSLIASKSGDTFSSELVKGMKKELSRNESGLSQSSQCDTPLKLLNLPGFKHRYETSLQILKHDEKQKDAVQDEGVLTEGTKNDLTFDKTNSYFMRRRGSVSNSDHDSSLNLEVPKKKRSKKRYSKQKEMRTRNDKSNKKVRSQSVNESKKVGKDHKEPSGKHSSPAVNQSRSSKKLEKQISKTSVAKNNTNGKKIESAGVIKKQTDTAKDSEWESKYFTKASEMFFRMFSDSVAKNNVSLRGGAKTSDFHLEGIDANKGSKKTKSSPPEVSGIPTSSMNTKDALSRVEAAKLNRALPNKKAIETHSAVNSHKANSKVEKSENKKVAFAIPQIKKTKTQAAHTDNDEKLKAKQRAAKNIDGPKVNKLKMLQSPDGRIESETSLDEKKEAKSNGFDTKITGMEKYHIEKNANIKKEITLNSSIDFEKLFEESSTIPLHSSSASEKIWKPPVSGTKSNFANQSILQDVNATSDRGRGDSVNMVNFSVCKSPFLRDQGSTGYEVRNNRVNSSLEKSNSNEQAASAQKSFSSAKNDNNRRATVFNVPISSKNIKQVNPQNYKEHILNSSGRKMDDEIPRSEKSNKWERILTVFKQIIIKDLEDDRPDFSSSIKTVNNLKKPPAQPRETQQKVSDPPLKSSHGKISVKNQTHAKGKISAKVKKKTEFVKKKQPAETIKRIKFTKKNPKKIINYFSKRGEASSYEKPSSTVLAVNPFEQTPATFHGHSVNVGNHTKPSMSIPPKMK